MKRGLNGKIGGYGSIAITYLASMLPGCSNYFTPGPSPIVTPTGQYAAMFKRDEIPHIFSTGPEITIEFKVSDPDENLSELKLKTSDVDASGLTSSILDNQGNIVDLSDELTSGIYKVTASASDGSNVTFTFWAEDNESNVSKKYTWNVIFDYGGTMPPDQNDDIIPSRLNELLQLACSTNVQNLRPTINNIQVYNVDFNNNLTINNETTNLSDRFHHHLNRGEDYILLAPKNWVQTAFSEIPAQDLGFTEFSIVDANCGAAVIHDAFGASTVTVSGNIANIMLAKSENLIAENP